MCVISLVTQNEKSVREQLNMLHTLNWFQSRFSLQSVCCFCHHHLVVAPYCNPILKLFDFCLPCNTNMITNDNRVQYFDCRFTSSGEDSSVSTLSHQRD